MGVINMIPNIDIFFGGLSGKSHPILSRSAARGQGGLVSIFVKVTRSEEEVKEEEAKRWRGGRQHVNEPAQCHWAPHRTAIWRIKDSYHLAASPTLYPHRIRINQIVLCHNTPWPFGGGKKGKVRQNYLKKKKITPVTVHEHGKRKQAFDSLVCLPYFKPGGRKR